MKRYEFYSSVVKTEGGVTINKDDSPDYDGSPHTLWTSYTLSSIRYTGPTRGIFCGEPSEEHPQEYVPYGSIVISDPATIEELGLSSESLGKRFWVDIHPKG